MPPVLSWWNSRDIAYLQTQFQKQCRYSYIKEQYREVIYLKYVSMCECSGSPVLAVLTM